ncbi:hypothetical protein CCZ01_00050 [Helicobacter monodelphidis]|nr:hypothetical protein [Helicobacter sp. 15-1451]RAX59177.1 hypothetical protein CCZ01_00050 [Helicobacter sp. 15-1451]
MEQEIERLVPLGYFQHCQDSKVKNVFDISVRRLKNPNDFLNIAQRYQSNHQGFRIIDETINKAPCFHIEITQP